MLLLAVPTPACAGREKDFTEEVVALAGKQFPGRKVSRGKDPLTLMVGEARLGLDNLLRNCGDLPAPSPERERCIVRFLTSTLAAQEEKTPATWEEARPRIRPQLIPKDYLRATGETNFVSSPSGLSGELFVAFALDSEQTIRYVNPTNLKSWGIGEDAVRDAGWKNLEAASAGLDLTAEPGHGGKGHWLALQETDGYSAVRIGIPSVRRRITEQLGSPFFMAIPNRNFLVCWSQDFPKAEEFEARVEEDFAGRPHPLSPLVYVVDERGIRTR